MLIKTDSQNYTNIADAIREVTGSTQQYKPEEMEPVLTNYVPEGVISYDEFDEDGNVLTVTVYGDKVFGLAGSKVLQTVNTPTATVIGDYAFAYSDITSISLSSPDNITSIGDRAFYLCSDLENITLSNNIKSIGEYSFCNCNKLSISALPESLVDIGVSAFGYCNKISISELPKGVTIIPNGTFTMCKSISELTFHENIAEIGWWAFYGCDGLTKVTFKGTPKLLGMQNILISDYNVFASCPNLTTINVPWSEGEVDGAPWGATNATINYNYTVE